MGCCSSKYEVFISFRGADVRENFLSHLFSALKRHKIKVFKDENLKRGEEIAPSLLKIIKKSRISIVIFSQYYPNSPWYLDELLKIYYRKKKRKQKVIPVFYGVDPSDVQQLEGNYGSAIHYYNQNPKFRGKVKNWIHALMDISNLSGFHSDNPQLRPEAKLIEEVVKYVSHKLNEGSCQLIGVLIGVVACSLGITAS